MMLNPRTQGFASLLFFSLLYLACDGCDRDEMVRGCRISQGQCLCGIGCDTEYPYANREECRAALKGRSQDACSMNPCNNNGACIQTPSSYMKFKCRCEGTGFYGSKCQYVCPPSSAAGLKSYPFECIEI